jgi:hypothetical protein
LGDQLLSTLAANTDHLLQLLLGLGPQDRQKPCYHPGGIVPAENFANVRFKELALHQWDIRSVLEPGAIAVRSTQHAGIYPTISLWIQM